MAPPELAADVPVAHLGHPVLPDLDEALRQDLGPAGARGLQRGRGQRRDSDEPLGLEARLHDVVGALAVAEQHLVGLDRLQVAARLQCLHDLAAGLVAIQAGELGAVLVDAGGVVEHGDHRQAVALAGLVVVLVVGRGDLHRAGPEGAIHHRVGDDRHRPVHERDHRPAADQRGVARILGVDRHGGVAQQRLRARRGDRDPGVRIGRAGRFVDQVVAHRPEAARRLLRDHLQVRDAGPAAGAPVDQRLGPVRQPFAIQAQERLADGPGRDLVHREAEAASCRARRRRAAAGPGSSRGSPGRTPTSARGTSRGPASRGSRPSWRGCLSRTYWAAIEAWSRPGRKSAGRPCIRAWRVIRSSTVERWAWPRCSEPVTLGGGWMMTKGCLVQSAREPLPSGLKTSASSQRW